MIFRKPAWRFSLQVVFLFLSLVFASYMLVQERYNSLVLLVPLITYQFFDLLRIQKKIEKELSDFVEAVHYRDFTRHFDIKKAPPELQSLRKGFNEINTTFRQISREKETHYQYLQKILELVDTGILSFNEETGEVLWMNESLKKLLKYPFLKSIYSWEKRDSDLFKQVLGIAYGETKIAVAHIEKNDVKVLMSATSFNTQGKKYKLIAFQNVNEALDETESKAWQKLLSVMTHEIMNSIAPISSLADTLKNRLQETAVTGASVEDYQDLTVGISTIKTRSEGLLKFAETYRTLNKITSLNLKKVYLRELFFNLQRLMEPTFSQRNIQLDIILKDPSICLEADPNLLDQVLINLVTNAIEAVKEQPSAKIQLAAYTTNEDKVVIKVSDNGIGMSKELQEKIFIPFFTTKKQGSGIGLSLCKQIVMLHKGTIQVQSTEAIGSEFILKF